MGLPVPEIVIGFTAAEWSKKGFVPVWLWRLMYDRGYTFEEITDALTELIGPDFAQVNGTEWIARMEAKDVPGIWLDETPEYPVLDIVDDFILWFLTERNKGCDGCCGMCGSGDCDCSCTGPGCD